MDQIVIEHVVVFEHERITNEIVVNRMVAVLDLRILDDGIRIDCLSILLCGNSSSSLSVRFGAHTVP